MPDIGDLLSGAARSPRSTPDLANLERRAHSRRRSQQAIRGTAALSIVALVAVIVAVSGGSSGSQRLLPVTGATATPAPTSASTPGPSNAPVLGPRTTATPVGSAGRAPSTPQPVRSAASSQSPRPGLPTARPQPSPTGFPAAASCSVRTDTATLGETRTCRFTATVAGGWSSDVRASAGDVFQTKVDVAVTRNGQTRRYGDYARRNCGDAVIRPGDQVTVTARQANPGYFDFEVGAGDGYGCASAP